MFRSKLIVHMSLVAAFALAAPVFADKGGSGGPSKPEDTPKVDDRGGATSTEPAPSTPGTTKPDDKGVDPASKPDDKGVDPASKPDDKGVDPATKPDDKGVDPATKPDDRGVDPATNAEDTKSADLVAAPEGERIHARGQVEIRSERELENNVERQKERLRVKVEMETADGTSFIVWVNGMPAGVILMRSGRGELQLENEPGRIQPAGVFPVRGIKAVAVVNDLGALVLKKDF